MNVSRQLKLFGLAVLAVLAIGALPATGAQAGQFTAAEFPATITGQNVAGEHFLKTDLGVLVCSVTFHGNLEAASETLTIGPSYGTGCKIAGIEVHVTNNGCDFLFRAGNTLGEDEVGGAMDISCPEGSAMDFEITSMMVCHLTIPGQNGLAGLTYTDHTMSKDVDIDFGIEGIVYKMDAGCPVAGIRGNGTYTGTSTIKADHAGMGTGFSVD
jgi:hypothetical protein